MAPPDRCKGSEAPHKDLEEHIDLEGLNKSSGDNQEELGSQKGREGQRHPYSCQYQHYTGEAARDPPVDAFHEY